MRGEAAGARRTRAHRTSEARAGEVGCARPRDLVKLVANYLHRVVYEHDRGGLHAPVLGSNWGLTPRPKASQAGRKASIFSTPFSPVCAEVSNSEVTLQVVQTR